MNTTPPQAEPTTAHTPTPWKQHETEGKTYATIRGANNETIADCGSRSDLQAQANARFIVTACNSHERLVEALKCARSMITGDTARSMSEKYESINALLAEIEGQ